MPTAKLRQQSKAIPKRPRQLSLRDIERRRAEHARETREWIYLFTILDFIWFTGDLPDHPAVPFILLINPETPKPFQLPKELEALANLSESQMKFIRRQLGTPDWTTRTDVGRSRMTLSDTLLWIGLDRPTDAFLQPKSDSMMNSTVMPNIEDHPELRIPARVTSARRWFYSYKILNLLWFDGFLPVELNHKFQCLVNPDWPQSPLLPESIREILDLSESEVQFICGRMVQSEWCNLPNVIHRETSLQKAYFDWPVRFE